MESPCPNKEVCGSCGWSHIPYEKQLQQKLSDINGSLKLKELEVTCEEILASPKTAHYRNRMDFVIDFEGRVGLRQKGKWWRVIDNHTCFIADEQIEKLFHIVRDWAQNGELSYFDRKAHIGLLRYAVIRTTTLGETMMTVVTSAPESDEDKQKIKNELTKLVELTAATTVIWSINHTVTDVSFGSELYVISGPGYIEEEINGFRYRITPNAFFQTNSFAAPLLMDTALEFAGDTTDKTIIDLYCGSGFFSIPLANQAKRVVGVELVPEAIQDARVNAELNDVEVEFHDAKTEEFDWMSVQPDVLLLDPPRAGMHDKALEDVLNAKPERIVYVSCNYKNFARELVKLGEYYDVSAMRAIDMFPHTPHVELIAQLDRKG